MNTIKTISALFLLSACTGLTGCAEGSKSTGAAEQSSSSAATDTAKASPAGPVKSTTPVTADELIDFRGDGRSSNTSDYGATEGKYRLYGIDGDHATIAELGTWITRQYKVGDAFGRGFVVSQIAEDRVTLHGPEADLELPVGVDVDVRVIRHRLDVVAQPLGKHRFNLSNLAAQGAVETNPARPTIEKADLYDQAMIKLGPIPVGSLWAGADLREGDLIASVDGKPVDGEALSAIETALTTATKLDLTIYRGGVSFNRRYEVDAVR